MSQAQDYLSFRVGREWYGIEVSDVIEVLHFLALSDLPGSSPDVLGLMTLRDKVMPVVDLRLRFGLADAPLHLDTPIIAIRTPEGAMGLVVDDTDNVERVSEAQRVAHDHVGSPYVSGLAKLPGRLLLFLNIALLRAASPVASPA